IKRIGSGAFADVYQADLTNSNLKNLKCVALKVFRQFEESEALRKAILKEVADFGLSRCLSDASKTITGLAGYIPYMDPYVLKNSEQKLQIISKECDVYSLGVLLWEISSLHPPFEEEDRRALYIKILNGYREIPILGTPPQFFALYTECWQDDPKKRPTIDKVVYELSDDKSDGINETINSLNEEASSFVPMEYEVTRIEENQFR
ncbi:28174_t:CDS:2, partial [Racocetra persica]